MQRNTELLISRSGSSVFVLVRHDIFCFIIGGRPVKPGNQRLPGNQRNVKSESTDWPSFFFSSNFIF